ncbi:hypothetical protein ABBQ32_010589 [Trebouxia sp. C0010 RCD-2024]
MAVSWSPMVAAPLLLAVAALFHVRAPEPYMDEPFHVPQTQHYCKGDFSNWDVKITTFPGLYFVGAAWAKLLNYAHMLYLPAQVQDCSTTTLRTTNILLGLVCLRLLHALYKALHPEGSHQTCTQTAWLIFLFPLHFFFHFLYYTDVGSVTFVVAAYLACMKHRYRTSALLACWAVLFRQTNAVWVCFIIGMSVLGRTLKPAEGKPISATMLQQCLQALTASWKARWQLLADLWPMLLVPACFAAFVVWNGGIVLGDKAAHTPVQHLMQPLYFVLFTVAALGPFHFSPFRISQAAKQLSASMKERPLPTLLKLGCGAAAAYLLVDNYTLVHPYLLADNRHYTFYIWKNFFGRYVAARFWLIPLYLYSAWSLWDSITRQQSKACALLLALCTAVSLIPAWLIEFRCTPFTAFLQSLLEDAHSCSSFRQQEALPGLSFAVLPVNQPCLWSIAVDSALLRCS